MKTLLLLAAFLFSFSGLPAYAVTVTQVMGSAADCNPTLIACGGPGTPELLCDGDGATLDCPQYFAPDWVDTTGQRFFGITNRTNPPRCVMTTNGGAGNWSLCPSNPFGAALDFFGANFTVASDGSLIASADQGANNCIIVRSTDYGVSWNTVFTDASATESCAVGFGNPTPSMLRCAQSNPYCVSIGFSSGFDLIAYYSTNNGASWTKGVAFTLVSGDQEVSVSVAANGGSGSLTRYNQVYAQATFGFASMGGADWTRNSPIPQPGDTTGTAVRCASMSFVFGSQGVICGPDNVNSANTNYGYFTHGGGSVSFAGHASVEGGKTFAQSPDYMAGVLGSRVYLIGADAATGTLVSFWVGSGALTAFTFIGTKTPATTLIPGCCRGDTAPVNGMLYFTGGGTSSQAFFGRIK